MSSEFFIVNLNKRQYLDPRVFGELETANGYMKGFHATAVALLVCDPGGYTFAAPWGGAWCGDKVLAVYDSWPPDALGFSTATPENPNRNLYEMAWREFVDIGPKAIAMVCNWVEDSAESLAGRVVLAPRNGLEVLDEHLLWQLGAVAIDERCSILENSLEKHIGRDWKNKYKTIKEFYDSMKHFDDESDL